MFETILKVAMVIISVALIILCLLQSGKSDDIVNALTGQSSNLFAEQKERGVDLVMSRMTMILSIAFFVIAILLRMNWWIIGRKASYFFWRWEDERKNFGYIKR